MGICAYAYYIDHRQESDHPFLEYLPSLTAIRDTLKVATDQIESRLAAHFPHLNQHAVSAKKILSRIEQETETSNG